MRSDGNNKKRSAKQTLRFVVTLRESCDWSRGKDSNQRPSGYEPDELPGCSTPQYALRFSTLIYNTTIVQSCQAFFTNKACRVLSRVGLDNFFLIKRFYVLLTRTVAVCCQHRRCCIRTGLNVPSERSIKSLRRNGVRGSVGVVASSSASSYLKAMSKYLPLAARRIRLLLNI